MDDSFPELLTFQEAKQLLRIKDTKLYELLRAGQIVSYRDGGRYLITKQALFDYLESIKVRIDE